MSLTKRIIELKKVEQYKDDARSSVWRVVDEGVDGESRGGESGGGWVIKRFEYWSVRQVLGWLIGMHPGQFEYRRNRKLRRLGVDVVEIEQDKGSFLVVNNPTRTQWDTLAGKLNWAETPRYNKTDGNDK